MNYTETTEYLFTAMPSFQNVGSEAYKPGLERIHSFCKALGNPERSYPTIHIAGTNGKGSTSNMLASVLHSAGYRVGLFTSPHLRDFRERMRVDGEMISEQEVVDFVAQHRETMELQGLSFFEMTASMAFDFFARSMVDVAVVECGLGGRLDATNIVVPLLSIITNIGLDHTQYLGTTLPQIAAEKGGIIKRGVPVVVGEHGEQSDDVFCCIAEQQESQIIFAQDQYRVREYHIESDFQQINLINSADIESSYSLDLRGEYQQHNVVTLLAALDTLASLEGKSHTLHITPEAIEEGLSRVTESMHLEGRWQQICDAPRTICDTGHNLHGLSEVARQLSAEKYNKLYCVMGFARDKDLQHILPLFPAEAHFIFTRPKVERAFTTAEIGAVAEALHLHFEIVEDVRTALDKAKTMAQSEDLIFVGGSNFVVSEIL